jgi:hypothetical protein
MDYKKKYIKYKAKYISIRSELDYELKKTFKSIERIKKIKSSTYDEKKKNTLDLVLKHLNDILIKLLADLEVVIKDKIDRDEFIKSAKERGIRELKAGPLK